NPDDREKYQERVDLVQRAYDMMTDFAKVAILAKEKGVAGLEKVELSVGRPLKVMLFQKARDMEDAFKTVGKLAAVEYKYDGFRVQIHKKGDKIKVFTRRLENATKQFPDVVKNVNDHVKGDEFVLDAEAVGYDPKTGKYLPFQSISQRIKRKYDIEDIAKKFPVEVNVFDILLYDGKDLISKPFLKRRKLIETIITPKEKQLVCSKQIITDSVEKAQEFYQAALDAGQEGVMLKNLKGIYKPGSRVGFGVKVKPVMESLDLVIVGAEWGEGKRSGWLTSLQLACYDPDTGGFLTIGKVGTGLKELEQEGGVTFGEVTALLRPHITQEDGREVVIKPELVIEINFEEIQKSPTYGSGYALRFPRVVRVRDDRRPEECSDIDFVEELYRTQRSRG
ncbi:MAG: ATP-dependent DNA ligase, partial [Candidatus Nanoarchaeia archaeon]